MAGRLAACIDDPREPMRTVHTVADIVRFRRLMIAAGDEDGIDANALRSDPVFKMALERLPGEHDLRSQFTVSLLENLPDRRMHPALAARVFSSCIVMPVRSRTCGARPNIPPECPKESCGVSRRAPRLPAE